MDIANLLPGGQELNRDGFSAIRSVWARTPIEEAARFLYGAHAGGRRDGVELFVGGTAAAI